MLSPDQIFRHRRPGLVRPHHRMGIPGFLRRPLQRQIIIRPAAFETKRLRRRADSSFFTGMLQEITGTIFLISSAFTGGL